MNGWATNKGRVYVTRYGDLDPSTAVTRDEYPTTGSGYVGNTSAIGHRRDGSLFINDVLCACDDILRRRLKKKNIYFRITRRRWEIRFVWKNTIVAIKRKKTALISTRDPYDCMDISEVNDLIDSLNVPRDLMIAFEIDKKKKKLKIKLVHQWLFSRAYASGPWRTEDVWFKSYLKPFICISRTISTLLTKHQQI